MTPKLQQILFAAVIILLIFGLASDLFPTSIQLALATIAAALVAAVIFIGLSKLQQRASSSAGWTIDANALNDAIFATDINGHILGMNDLCRALFPSSVDAKNVMELFEPLHEITLQRTQAEDVVNAVLASPDIQFSDRLNLSDNRKIDRTTRPIASSGNRIWILNDVTHAVLADNDSAMHQTMVEADAVRTAELAEQLYHAKAELEQKQTELTRLANTDPMTGLYNRRRFFSLAEEIINQSSSSTSLWVVMLDIDHFKHVNDTYGHAAGDVAIRDFAKLISAGIDGNGFIGRLGGEEFAAVLTDCSADQAFRIAESIRGNTMQNLTISESDEIRFTTSIGVAPWLPAEASIEPAVDRADRALYSAKAYGRNRVVGYE